MTPGRTEPRPTAETAPAGRIVVVVPAFQEEAAIAEVVAEVRRAAPGAEVVVVNDGSSDRTGAIARATGAIVLDLPFNLGIGGAVQTGLRWAARRGAAAVVQVDGDGQHVAEEIPRLLEPLSRGEADLVIGSRFLSLSSFRTSGARRLGIVWLSACLRLLGGGRIRDVTSGFRGFGERAIELLAEQYPEDYPEPESILLVRRRGLRIAEVPVRMRPRQGGESSISSLHSLYYMVKVTLALLVDRVRSVDERRVAPRR